MILLDSTDVFLELSVPTADTTASMVFGSIVIVDTGTGASTFFDASA